MFPASFYEQIVDKYTSVSGQRLKLLFFLNCLNDCKGRIEYATIIWRESDHYWWSRELLRLPIPSPTLCLRISLDIGTSFCPKAAILHFSTRSTPHVTAQPFQHLIRSWVVQIEADSLRLLLVAGNFCWRQDRIVRDFARSAVIFIWVSRMFDIVDIHSLAVHLQLDLSSENS